VRGIASGLFLKADLARFSRHFVFVSQAALPNLDYPFHDKAVTVTTCGRICFNRQKINLSQVFAGQTVGIKQTDDRIWLVSFMNYDLGYFDLEQKTLQPLDNPFGTRLSPMS
jgi:putative transposase